MGVQVLLPLGLLFIALGIPSNAQNTGAAEASTLPAPAPAAAPAAPAADALPVQYYSVGGPLVVNCSLADAGADASLPYVWRVNGTLVSEAPQLAGRHKLLAGGAQLQVAPGARSQEDDFGNYTCARGAAAAGVQLRGRPVAKLPPNTNVVEGQKFKISCRVIGKPHPAVTWTFENGSDVRDVLGDRALFKPNEQGIPDATLVVEVAARADAGNYTCWPLVPDAGAAALEAGSMLRVKDMYAALWPFLGICAEVLVLCAVILLYERRRTKPDLDDSDTDHHDQKKS